MTRTLRIEQIVPPLLTHGRAIMLETWRPDSCIAAARICKDVLEYFEIKTRAETCRAYVATNPLMQRLDDGVPINNKFGPGEHSVGIGYDTTERPGKMNGHVISRAISSGDRLDWFIDLSLDQADRREKGMPVEAFAFKLTERERWPGRIRRRVNKHVQVIYEPLRGPDAFLSKAPDWIFRERFREVVPRIIEAIREHAV